MPDKNRNQPLFTFEQVRFRRYCLDRALQYAEIASERDMCKILGAAEMFEQYLCCGRDEALEMCLQYFEDFSQYDAEPEAVKEEDEPQKKSEDLVRDIEYRPWEIYKVTAGPTET